jgi:hypothetical protein
MAVSIFDEKAITPNDEMVAAFLGDAYPLLHELHNYVQAEYPDAAGEWKHYGKAAGWWFKFLYKKRILITYAPNQGYFRVRVGVGETEAYMGIAEIPGDVKEAIRAATPYVEGRYIDLDISRREQLETLKTLIKIKFK